VGYVVADDMVMVTEFAARGSLLGYLRDVAKTKASSLWVTAPSN